LCTGSKALRFTIDVNRGFGKCNAFWAIALYWDILKQITHMGNIHDVEIPTVG